MKNTVSTTVIYAIITLAALILMIGYRRLIKKKEKWLQYLYFAVFGVNAGYFLLSISGTLHTTLFANGIVYLFSAFLPFFMLMTIMNACKLQCSKRIFTVLVLSGCLLFCLAVSGGYLTLYYTEVQPEIVHGATVLIKHYGPLHSLFGMYLFLYFAGMLGVILYTIRSKKSISYKLALFLLAAVLCNLFVWLLEQVLDIEFEFLAASYIFTELLLLLLYMIVEEMTEDVVSEQTADSVSEDFAEAFSDNKRMDEPEKSDKSSESNETIVAQVQTRMEGTDLTGIEKLSVREMEVLLLIMDNKKRKDIADELEITENTVKKHTSHIFSKLGVSSRKELFAKCSHVPEEENGV